MDFTAEELAIIFELVGEALSQDPPPDEPWKSAGESIVKKITEFQAKGNSNG